MTDLPYPALPSAKRAYPADSMDTRFRGLALPIIKKPRGYFQSMFTRDIIRSSIFSILSTMKGERVFIPTFGSDLFKIIFEPNDIVTRVRVEQIVTKDVQQWEKRVQIQDVKVASNEHSIKVYVSYRIINTSILDAAVLEFDQKTQSVSLVST